MFRTFVFVTSVLTAAVIFEPEAAGQSTVEYSLAAAAGGAAIGALASRSSPVNSAATNLLELLDRTLKATASSSENTVQLGVAQASGSVPATRATQQKGGLSVAAVATAPVLPSVPEPLPKYENPSQIQVGIRYDELIRRFGPPTLMVSNSQSSKLSYTTAEGTIEVEVLEGNVTSTRKPRS